MNWTLKWGTFTACIAGLLICTVGLFHACGLNGHKALLGAQTAVQEVAKSRLGQLHEECQAAADSCKQKSITQDKCTAWLACDARRVEWDATVRLVEDGLLRLDKQMGGGK